MTITAKALAHRPLLGIYALPAYYNQRGSDMVCVLEDENHRMAKEKVPDVLAIQTSELWWSGLWSQLTLIRSHLDLFRSESVSSSWHKDEGTFRRTLF